MSTESQRESWRKYQRNRRKKPGFREAELIKQGLPWWAVKYYSDAPDSAKRHVRELVKGGAIITQDSRLVPTERQEADMTAEMQRDFRRRGDHQKFLQAKLQLLLTAAGIGGTRAKIAVWRHVADIFPAEIRKRHGIPLGTILRNLFEARKHEVLGPLIREVERYRKLSR